MPPPHKPDISKAAAPQYGAHFDAWNSSATGHQRAENRLGGSTGWRDSRTTKLQSQFKSGADGGKRMSDAVGAGSDMWDPSLKAIVPSELRSRANNSVMDMLTKPGTMKLQIASAPRDATPALVSANQGSLGAEERLMLQRQAEDEARHVEKYLPKKIFDGVVVYINGSTHPIISDHKLKHVLAEHGARISIHLARRQVTHVILGKPAGGGGGAGGGLAGGKLHKEIQKVGGAAVKFVGVEWVLESIKTGKRLPEARFGNLKIAPKGQQSVLRIAFQADAATASPRQISSATTSFQPSTTNHADDAEVGIPNFQDNEPPPSAQRPQ